MGKISKVNYFHCGEQEKKKIVTETLRFRVKCADVELYIQKWSNLPFSCLPRNIVHIF